MTDVLFRFTIDADPVPKSRPRAGKGRVYTPQKTRDAEEVVLRSFQQAFPGAKPAEGDLGILLEFRRGTRRRVDWDNLAKLCTDALNGVAFEDDSQIVEAMVTLAKGCDDPHTAVTIYRP